MYNQNWIERKTTTHEFRIRNKNKENDSDNKLLYKNTNNININMNINNINMNTSKDENTNYKLKNIQIQNEENNNNEIIEKTDYTNDFIENFYMKNNPVKISKDIFDIVILVGPNDYDQINRQINYTKKNIIGYRKIFLVVSNPNIKVDGTEVIDEKIFPFNMKTIIKYQKKTHRNGWYLQQLLKLYSGFIIPEIADKFLIIDCDTYFLKPTRFIDIDDNKYLYGISTIENHKPYYIHMENLHPELTKVIKESGVCHHMFFVTDFLKEIFDLVEKYHKKPFFEVFLEKVESQHFLWSGASEYEIYSNYVFKFHKSEVKIRRLNWKNVRNINDIDINPDNYDFISYHWHERD